MKDPEAVGFHGAVIRSSNPRAAARVWSRWTGLEVHRRGRGYLLGNGAELFVLILKAPAEAPGDRVEELHLAVRRRRRPRRPTARDAMGGESVREERGGLRLVVREFRREPSASWRRRRGGR